MHIKIVCDCVAVDFNRVVLEDGDPTLPGADYINANIISVSSNIQYSNMQIGMATDGSSTELFWIFS